MDRYEINTSHTRREIRVEGEHVSFPERYLELYFVDLLDELQLPYIIVGDRVLVRGNQTLADRLQHHQISITHAQHWYPSVKEITFPSILIPLDRDTIDSLLHHDSASDHYRRLIKQMHTCTYDEVFIRLNSVSPKPHRPSDNHFYTKDKNWAERALALLLESSRTCDTLCNHLFDHYIMLRQWTPIDDWQEFRCFIYRNRLTAISQYHCYSKFKKLAGKIFLIRQVIVAFYQEVYSFIPYEDCVMDVIVNGDEVTIVEFNSFGADGIAGSGLYNWEQDEDILLSTNDGLPSIRLLT